MSKIKNLYETTYNDKVNEKDPRWGYDGERAKLKVALENMSNFDQIKTSTEKY